METLISHQLVQTRIVCSRDYLLKFGFPLSYTSDILEGALALSEAGCARDPRLGHALDSILSKREEDGRWTLRHSLNGRMLIDIERKGEPSKWVTLRALRVLKAAGVAPAAVAG